MLTKKIKFEYDYIWIICSIGCIVIFGPRILTNGCIGQMKTMSQNFYQKVCDLNRFEQILRHLYLNDHNPIHKEDRLYKLRPFIAKLNEILENTVKKQNLSVLNEIYVYIQKPVSKNITKLRLVDTIEDFLHENFQHLKLP